MPNDEELKNCPFKGCIPEHWGTGNRHYFGCECCVQPDYDSKAEAIKAWNTRPPEGKQHRCESGSFTVEEATLGFLQKYTKMPNATFEDILREIDVRFSEGKQELDFYKVQKIVHDNLIAGENLENGNNCCEKANLIAAIIHKAHKRGELHAR